jgi:hypothetical protein
MVIAASDLLSSHLIPFTTSSQSIFSAIQFMLASTCILLDLWCFWRKQSSQWTRLILFLDIGLNLLFAIFCFSGLLHRGYRLGIWGCVLSSCVISSATSGTIFSLLGIAYDRHNQTIRRDRSPGSSKRLLFRSILFICLIFGIWPLMTTSYLRDISLSPPQTFCYINFASGGMAVVVHAISYITVMVTLLGVTVLTHEIIRRKRIIATIARPTVIIATNISTKDQSSNKSVLSNASGEKNTLTIIIPKTRASEDNKSSGRSSSHPSTSNEAIEKTDWAKVSHHQHHFQTDEEQKRNSWIQHLYIAMLYVVGWLPCTVYPIYEIITGQEAPIIFYGVCTVSISFTSIISRILVLYSE